MNKSGEIKEEKKDVRLEINKFSKSKALQKDERVNQLTSVNKYSSVQNRFLQQFLFTYRNL